MHIFELNYPGTWLEFQNEELKFEIEGMLRSLEGVITEAAISLSMYEACRRHRSDPREEWDKDAELRRQINEEIRVEAGEAYFNDFEKYRLISEKLFRAKKAELGIWPRSYIQRIPFIHAHTFVYAVDSFGKFLAEINAYDGMPEVVTQCEDEFNRQLPSVRKIRNSALHIEDRSRGYGSLSGKKNGKKMELKGFLGLSNFEGNFLCYTIEDGSYQKVEISVGVLNILVQLANRLLASFQWKGPARVEPSY